MFSGIIEKQGKLIRRKQKGKRMTLAFESDGWKKPLKYGESISINGVCLSVTSVLHGKRFTADVVAETLDQTTLETLKIKESVNLERSLKWGERIGGHFVLGHVDGVGRVIRKKTRGKSLSLQIEVPTSVLQHLVPKGSIAVDGVSLTVQKISGSAITIAVIPLTAKVTTLGRKKSGDRVNLEADVIAKHLACLVQPANTKAAHTGR